MTAAVNSKLSDEIRQYFDDYLGITLPSVSQISICCPLHEERSPSFSMDVDTGLWTCHAKCGSGNFPKLQAKIEAKLRSGDDIPELPDGMREEIAEENAAEPISETVYAYHNEVGTELFRVIRYDLADGSETFKSERPDGKGDYISGIKDVERVPYRLPELSKANLVIICEGEKCADAVNALDLSNTAGCEVAATCNYGGADKWRHEYSSYFRGKRVVLLPDNDDKGRQHMNSVAQNLRGTAGEIKTVELPGLPEKGDVVEFIACEDQAATKLLKLIQEARPLIASDQAREAPGLMSVGEVLAMCKGELSWVVKDLLVAGGLSLLVAKPKDGKSTLARNELLSVARGQPFLGRETKQGPVIYVCIDEPIELAVDHFKALGVTGSDPIKLFVERPTVDQLRAAIISEKPVLVVIDTWFKFNSVRKIDDYTENMRALEEMRGLCREFGTHLSLLHHMKKLRTDEPFDGVLGSTAMYGSVDTAIAMWRLPDQRRVVSTSSRRACDLDRNVLDYNQATGRITLGDTVEVIKATQRQEKAETIKTELIQFISANPSSTEEQIHAAVRLCETL